MRGNEFLDNMELVDAAYVEAADATPKRKIWIRWAAMAASLCLIVSILFSAGFLKFPGVGSNVIVPQPDPTFDPIATGPQIDPTFDPIATEDPTCGTDPQPISFIIFVPNEEGDGFLQLDATIEQLDPHLILQQLQDAGVIAQDAVVLASAVDGNNMLTLDMNEAFLQQLSSLDSADESMLMSCLVNTYLSAYAFCECMMVTAEGDIIHTNHADYDSPMCGLTDSN